MDLNQYVDCIPLEYFIIRKYVVSSLGLNNLSIHDKKFLYPLENVNRETLSLTDRIDADNQIRYFLSDRTLRKVSELAKKIAESEPEKITISPGHTHSVLMRHFIRSLERMQVSVQFDSNPDFSKDALLTANETELIQQLIMAARGDYDLVVRCIKQIINCGDVFSAETLLEHGLRYFPDFESKQANLIGTIKNCVGKPVEAEHYYQIFKKSESPLAPVRANYPLSMLYLRHHKLEKRNFETGKQYLTEAYDYIMNGGLDSLDVQERNFYTVFNRNGYGLVLFREGKVNEAIDLLRWGIETLSSESPKHYMHRSVILYNICQCYKKIGDYDSAIQCYKELLEIDYVFPEYHLEMGLCYEQQGNFKDYRACVEEAIRINPYNSDGHYYLSLIMASLEDYNEAEKHARVAWELAGDDMTAYNYAYLQSINGSYQDLDKLQPVNSPDYIPEWIVLKAEKISQTSVDDAVNILKEGIKLFPLHPELNENLKNIQGIQANA
ncbi:tetratricopeptide repeat protein [Klebsiella variicola]|uniref:tetratricopeptide repeat protein n=1 Tax=Klebsiella variicola TaxID=244366 RepID=UPI001CC978D2|nr:tetratricopeptide repeat protein [Klebsiella variicola]HBR2218126.1 tetratricopeptide repeat protein [Klebsiella pneumoniae]MBZ6550697.1 tetratricopeptide repeat protein [Klebsiella variicola]MBZ6577390.1 tetratricopeptide repeat protein [Klebsiella variicola]MBZ7586506.1 tetratricopeptide repeat protein [Klebsiella variicola]HDZ1811587.1 tetratricopeptide repeat protein [Klebsiella pneumoniae]